MEHPTGGEVMTALTETADRQALWSQTAGALKSSVTFARWSTFLLAILGALLATIASQLDQVPLLEMRPEGEVVCDVTAGRLHSVHLGIDHELHGLQGEGSSYHFQSNYTEQLVKE